MKRHADISAKLHGWLLEQPMFFVGTAPSGPEGHVNISPKGLAGSFTVLDPLRVAYLDYTGSGAETIAHLRDNGRIVVMFCSFEGAPQIVRLYGTGRPVFPVETEFDELRARFSRSGDKAIRAVIDIRLNLVTDSCGYSVPKMELVEERRLLDQWAERKTPEQLATYRAAKNATSIDGLPAIPR